MLAIVWTSNVDMLLPHEQHTLLMLDSDLDFPVNVYAGVVAVDIQLGPEPWFDLRLWPPGESSGRLIGRLLDPGD